MRVLCARLCARLCGCSIVEIVMSGEVACCCVVYATLWWVCQCLV